MALRSRTYAWVGAAYTAIGLLCLVQRYYFFGLMWVFFGLGALAEFEQGRNKAKWLGVAKWSSLLLGLVMVGLWIFVRR